jgi:outer membrane immunogenic protein
MRRLLTGTAMSLAMVACASAADLGPAPGPVYTKAPAYSWTGFYIGGHVGGGWANKAWFEDITETGSGGVGPVGFQDASYHTSGFLGGGQVGYNYQMGRWVFGIEGDFSGANITGSGNCFPEVVGTVQTCSTNIKSLGTVTGRIGAAWDRTLLYVKGGGAWVREDHANGCDICAVGGLPTFSVASETRGGWTVGVGAEYAFMGPWSAKLEYDYIGLGTRNLTFVDAPPSTGRFTEDVRQNLQLVKFGVNYRFGLGGPLFSKY